MKDFTTAVAGKMSSEFTYADSRRFSFLWTIQTTKVTFWIV